MNEMIAFPIVVGLIVGTAFLTALVSTALPYVPKWWNAFKSAIRRKETRKPNTDVAKLTKRVNELEEQVDNLAEALATRDRNRKSNTRREVRDYLEELRNK